MLENPGRPVIVGNDDIGKALVVAQQHIEARAQSLDEIGFQQQRFGFRMRAHEFHCRCFADHAGNAVGMAAHLGIGSNSLFQALCLADIKNVASRIEHTIDARRVWQPLDEFGNQRRAVETGNLPITVKRFLPVDTGRAGIRGVRI